MRANNYFFMTSVLALLNAGVAVAEDSIFEPYPIYQDGILTIPRVDTPDLAGKFLDAVFKRTDQDTWVLLSVKTADVYPLVKAPIEQVEVIVTDSFPVQVFLKAKGSFSNGCGELGQINQRLIDKRFEVTFHAEFPDIPPDSLVCTQAIRPFEKIIPLPVYDLEAGSYEYSVNGEFDGRFALREDNSL